MFLTLNTKSSIKFELIVVSMIFLSFASFTSQKYGFYTSLKVFLFISSLYLANLSYESKQNFWLIRFLIIALVYNPFMKLPFGKAIWIPINIVTLIFFAIALLRFKTKNDGTPEISRNTTSSKGIEALEIEQWLILIVLYIPIKIYTFLKKVIQLIKKSITALLNTKLIQFIKHNAFRLFRWLNYNADNVALRFDVSKDWAKACKICGSILFILFITDIHRFGSWWNGNAVHYRHEWFIFIIIALWIPFIVVAWQKIHVFLINHDQYELIWSIKLVVIVYTLCSPFMIFALRPNEDQWLERNYIILTIDDHFVSVMLFPLLISLFIWTIHFQDNDIIDYKNEEEETSLDIKYCPNCSSKKEKMLKFKDNKYWCSECGYIEDK